MAIKLDNTLLDELGLGGLPEDDKKQFLRGLYLDLEKNVGSRLAAGMSDDQLSQFERFASGDTMFAKQYLDSAVPNWLSLQDYSAMYKTAQEKSTRANQPLNEAAVVTEYAAFKWLELNFPTYKDVVAEEFEKLKSDVRQKVPHILAAVNNAPQAGADGAAAPGSFAPKA